MVGRKTLVLLLLAVLAIFLAGCVSTQKFKGYAPQKNKEVTIEGHIYQPEGDGPFPAVVILHGCAGITKRARMWAERLKGWGYVAIVVDSHRLRGVGSNCKEKKISGIELGLDAYSAKVYLAQQPFVDGNRIGLIGFSMGGNAVLSAVNPQIREVFLPESAGEPFKAAVAFYPYCGHSLPTETPLMIFIGEKDDWTPAGLCKSAAATVKPGGPEVVLNIYPGAYHCFDVPGWDMVDYGHRLKYDHDAAQKAKEATQAFFTKYLN